MKYKNNFTKFAAALVLAGALLTGCGRELPEQTTAPAETQAQVQIPVQTQPSIGETQTPETVQTEPSPLELTLESIVEQDQMMVAVTSYCEVSYPFAFSDVIRVNAQAQPGRGVLTFCAYLDQKEYPMFCIAFDGAEGIPVGTLSLADGSTVSVTAEIFPGEESLDSDMLHTFYAAQESINDVLSSLMDAEGFVPAQ